MLGLSQLRNSFSCRDCRICHHGHFIKQSAYDIPSGKDSWTWREPVSIPDYWKWTGECCSHCGPNWPRWRGKWYKTWGAGLHGQLHCMELSNPKDCFVAHNWKRVFAQATRTDRGILAIALLCSIGSGVVRAWHSGGRFELTPFETATSSHEYCIWQLCGQIQWVFHSRHIDQRSGIQVIYKHIEVSGREVREI